MAPPPPDFSYKIPVASLCPVVHVAHHSKAPKGLNIPTRVIHDFELVLILGGEGEFHILDRVIPYRAKDVLFTPPYCRHSYASPACAVPHHAIHFSVCEGHEERYSANASINSGFSGLRIRLAGLLDIPVHLRGFPDQLQYLFEDVIRIRTEVQVTHYAISELRLHQAMVNLLTGVAQFAHPQPGPVVFAKSIEHIDRHFTESLSIAALAGMEARSANYYSTRFRQAYGFSPVDYIVKKRMELARKLLMNRGLLIKEVAARCGYDDQYYFSRVFSSQEKISPRKFRELLL